MQDDKLARYRLLVQERKNCIRCKDLGLTNPSQLQGGDFDADEVGPWTRWNGDLQASLMLVGQEWVGLSAFKRQKGLDENTGTNKTLVNLFKSIGIPIHDAPLSAPNSGIFMTNAALCLKEGSNSAPVKSSWFRECGENFLKAQIELINPRVVVALGERAYISIRDLFECPRVSFRQAVGAHQAIPLGSMQSLVPVYHCSQTVLNTHRPLDAQLEDWRLVGQELSRLCRTPNLNQNNLTQLSNSQ